MRLVIFGGRKFDNYNTVKEEAEWFIKQKCIGEFEHVTIISGACSSGTLTHTRKDKTKVYGADGLGERFAEEFGYPIEYFPADWINLGKPAGPIRNKEMAKRATHGLGFWNMETPGTEDMAEVALEENVDVRLILY